MRHDSFNVWKKQEMRTKGKDGLMQLSCIMLAITAVQYLEAFIDFR